MTLSSNTVRLSVIVPVCNERENILPLHAEIREVLEKENISSEILFINDGSTDGSESVLEELKSKEGVRIFHLRKNYGKSAALACGFQNANGEFVVTLDGDLQDDPHEIPKLFLSLTEKKADMVSGWKKIRKDPFTKIISSRFFNFIVRMLTGIPLHDFNCGLKLYRREVIKEISLYGELHRFIPALAHWKGYRIVEREVNHRKRKHGKSKYSASRFSAGIVDLLTVIFLMRYEKKPSHLFSGVGLCMLTVGGAINAHLLVIKLFGGTISPRYPYMILGVLALIIGVQFIFFGLLSEMIVHLSAVRKSPYQIQK